MLLENNPYPMDIRVRGEAESLVSAGHAVEVVAPRGAGELRRERLRGVEVRRYRGFEGSRHGARGLLLEYLIAAIALHRAALRALLRGATVLHVHNPPDLLFPAAALFRLAGRKVVFDYHDLAPETVEVKFGRGVLSRLALTCERLTFACADHVIATNTSYAEIACGRGRKTQAEVTVVRNAPPSAWTAIKSCERGGRLQRLQIVYVGALSTQDGVEGLAPVLAGLISAEPSLDAHLTIVGDGDARASLQDAFARHGVGDRVMITGWVESERIPELLREADVCVDPAPGTEVNHRSTMVKIAEYLALGKPVVAYDLLETRRTAGDAALLVTPGDVEGFTASILELARDPDLRSRLGDLARRRAVDLTWEHSERALLSAYAKLEHGRRG